MSALARYKRALLQGASVGFYRPSEDGKEQYVKGRKEEEMQEGVLTKARNNESRVSSRETTFTVCLHEVDVTQRQAVVLELGWQLEMDIDDTEKLLSLSDFPLTLTSSANHSQTDLLYNNLSKLGCHITVTANPY